MPGPYPKFVEAFEIIQEKITELLTTQHRELIAAWRENPQAPAPAPLDLAALRTTIQQAIKDEVAAQSKTFVQQPQEKPNPLAFYETILRVRSTPNPSQNPFLPTTVPHPYFAVVFNDVVSYFGGPNTTDPIGRRFLEEAGKRFAYLRADVWGQKDVPLFQQGGMIMFNVDCTLETTPLPKSTSPRKCCILQQSKQKEIPHARQSTQSSI